MRGRTRCETLAHRQGYPDEMAGMMEVSRDGRRTVLLPLLAFGKASREAACVLR
jgi:hypothetical protein